jgi:putative membrane protein
MTVLIIMACVLAATPAAAHGDPDGTTSILGAWTYDPWILVPLYTSAFLYLLGTYRLWRRAGHGRGVRPWQVACFWTGWTMLALALVSPLHWLGERLFVAHMIEHEVLMVIAAPLLAVSRPFGAFLWALPTRWREGVGRAGRHRAVAAPWRVLRDPFSATLLHGVALWAWHAPALYNTVLTSLLMHRLQHASFFFSALLFWWTLFYGPGRHRGYGIAVSCLFLTSLHSTLLGILLTLARQPWYPQQSDFASICGLTPIEDQQLAGLVMWVPPGLIYLAAALYFAGRWISSSGATRDAGGRHALAPR